MTATMLGTIEKRSEKEHFFQGVYNFPVLDNPVWYVTAEDLDHIFDYKPKADVDYAKDYYLPIGKSPIFSDYSVKICPDQFFVKHAAILGNTGSGKSCTVASILHSLFDFNFTIKEGKKPNTGYLKNAHFVIFDTNGEYKKAFVAGGTKFERINALHIDENGLRVPL